MDIEDRIYHMSGIHQKVFIKLSDKYGIVFGEIRHRLYLQSQSDKPPEPDWVPAKEGDTFHGFHWMTPDHSDWSKSKPVKKELIKRFKLVEFIMETFGPQRTYKIYF